MGFNSVFNPLNAELNPICHLLALLGVRHIFHVSGLRVKGFLHRHALNRVSVCHSLRQIPQCVPRDVTHYGDNPSRNFGDVPRNKTCPRLTSSPGLSLIIFFFSILFRVNYFQEKSQIMQTFKPLIMYIIRATTE